VNEVKEMNSREDLLSDKQRETIYDMYAYKMTENVFTEPHLY